MLGDLIGTLSNYLYTYILVILLIAAGLYFTIRTRFVQFRMVRESIYRHLQTVWMNAPFWKTNWCVMLWACR